MIGYVCYEKGEYQVNSDSDGLYRVYLARGEHRIKTGSFQNLEDAERWIDRLIGEETYR